MNNAIPIELVGQTIRQPTYSVLVDMDNDGVYEVDITDDVDKIDYVDIDLELKDRYSALGKPSTSVASITLFNEHGLYSPNNKKNIESKHNGKFRHNTRVRILAGFIDENNQPQQMVIFTGVITNFRNKVQLNSKRMTLTIKDFSKFLQKKKNPNHSYANGKYYEGVLFDATITDAVNYLLDYGLGEGQPRTVHSLPIVYPVIEFNQDEDIWSTLQKLAEACSANMYFEGEEFRFLIPTSQDYTYNYEQEQASFTRASTAYKKDGSEVASGLPRYETLYGDQVLVEETTNLLPRIQDWIASSTTGYEILDDYHIQINANNTYFWCYVPVSAGQVYTYSFGESNGYAYFCWCDSAKNRISGRMPVSATSPRTETAPSGAAYAEFVLHSVNLTLPVIFSEWQFEQKDHATPFTIGYRPEQRNELPFGKGIVVEEGTTNLIPVDKQKFEGWSARSGAVVNLTQNQSVPEWGAVDATRIQTSGGTQTYKYTYHVADLTTEGTSYTFSVWIKNIGSATVGVSFYPGSNITSILPGESKRVSASMVGDGVSGAQIRLRALNAADSLDFIAWRPMAEVKAYSTSWHPTTRQPEVVTIKHGLTPEQGTIEGIFEANELSLRSGYHRIFHISRSGGYGIILRRNTTNWQLAIWADDNSVTSVVKNIVMSGFVRYRVTWLKSGGRAKAEFFSVNTKQKFGEIVLENVNFPSVLADTLYVGSYFTAAGTYSNTIHADIRCSSIARTDTEYGLDAPLPVDEWTTAKVGFNESLDIKTPGSYFFRTDNILEIAESTDEESVINKWEITSNGKTLQPRQVIVGTPTNNVLTAVEEYKTGDGKNAIFGSSIQLKTQDGETWIDTINVPLVDTTTLIDLTNPTQDDIDAMNANSTVKVWDKINGRQLTVQDLDPYRGIIVCSEAITEPYDLQITYQYYNNVIMTGKYRWFEFELDKVSRNIELPEIEAHDGFDQVTYSTETSANNLYLSDWQVIDGNKKIKFKLTNNIPERLVGEQRLDRIYLSKMEIFGNPLDCVNPLKFTAVDADTIGDFESASSIENDYIIDAEWGKKAVDFLLYKTQRAKSPIEAVTVGIPQIQILDRITVIEDVTGVDYDFIVTGIKHTMKESWKTILRLEPLVPAWVYDSSRVTVNMPTFDTGGTLTLPVIEVKSNGSIENNFANGEVTHSVTINFNSPASYGITNFLEGRIIYKRDDSNNYTVCGSFTDQFTSSYQISGLETGHTYTFYVVALNKFNSRSPYGDGLAVAMPTLASLQSTYGLLPQPTNLSLIKGVNGTISATSGVCPSTSPHFRLVRFQMVRNELDWTDESVITEDSTTYTVALTPPDEQNYKVRCAFVDIWDRVGTWSIERTVTGGGITSADLPAMQLELEVLSDPAPSSGSLTDLIDGTSSQVVFDSAASVTFKYPYENVFDLLRIRVPVATTMYVQVKDSADNWHYVIGTAENPVNVLENTGTGDANVFKFHTDGDMAGTETRKQTTEVKITFPSGAIIEDIIISTWRYLDTLLIGSGIGLNSGKLDGNGYLIEDNAGTPSIHIGISDGGNTSGLSVYGEDGVTEALFVGKKLEPETGTMKPQLSFRDENGDVMLDSQGIRGSSVKEIVWDSLHPTLQLVQVMNRDPFIIPENDGSYGLQLLSGTKEYKFFPSDDAHVYEYPLSDTKNYGTQNKMTIQNLPVAYVNDQPIDGTSHKKAYIRFNFDQSSIPAEEEITDVRLVFYAEGSKQSVVLHEVLSAWQELTITGRDQPNVAASEMIPAFNIASAGFIELVDPAIKAWVNAVKAGTKTNYGFRLWSTAEEGGKNLYIRSKEYSDVSYRPYLYVKTDTGAASGRNLTITPGKFYVRGQVKSLDEPYILTLPAYVEGHRYIIADLDADGNIVITDAFARPAGALILGRVWLTSIGIISVDMSRSTGRKEGGQTAAMFGNDMYKSDWIQIVPRQRQEVIHGLGPGRYGYFLEQQAAEGQPIYTRHMSGSKGVDVRFMPDGKTVHLQGGSTYTMTYLNDDGSEVNVASSRARITIWKIADS